MTRTANEIRDEGMKALRRALGPADMIRFLRMCEPGSGDYTRERKEWLEEDLDTIVREMPSVREEPVKTSGRDELELPIAAIVRIARKNGAERISAGAAELMARYTQEYIRKLVRGSP
jgi:hypothetical protein